MSGMSRKIVFCVLAALCVLPLAAQEAEGYGSSDESDSIMTVEEAYLSSAESVIIRELARSSERDAKLLALQYIEEAVDGGGASSDIIEALNVLAGEGLFTTVRESGRVINNYPDIRMKACELLGKTGSEEAVQTLVSVIYVDNEPAVVTAAVKALGDLGYNENDEVVEMINWTARRFDIVLPTNSLALEVLNAYEKIAGNVEDKGGMIEMIVRIAGNYNYATAVRNRAYEVLRSVQSQSNESGGEAQDDAYYGSEGSQSTQGTEGQYAEDEWIE